MALAVLGMANGTWLTIVHIDYELDPESALRQVCGALAANGCAVTTGRFGALWGVPVSLIGLGGASATALTAALAWRHRDRPRDPWRSMVLLLAAISVLASMLMGALSAIEGSFCPFCVAWYGINLAMAVCADRAWRSGRGTATAPRVRTAMGRTAIAAMATFAVSLSLGYLGYSRLRASILADRAQATLDRLLEHEEPIALDLEGLPSTGPSDAPLTVVEVVDFECPFCRVMWEGIRRYTESSSSDVRIVVLHFPVDESCNAGVIGVHYSACAAARAAECARRSGAFFEYGDLLFDNQPSFGPDRLVAYAARLGIPEDEFRACLDDEDVALEVGRSIKRARRLKIETTPTFLVNGYRFTGTHDSKWIRLVFDGLSRRALQAS